MRCHFRTECLSAVHRIPAILAISITGAILSGLIGCSLFGNTTATLWTNQPEMAAYVEQFNSTQDQYHIKIVYRESPVSALPASYQLPDLVIGEYLNSPTAIGKFHSLEKLFRDGFIPEKAFYHELLQRGRKQEEQYLIPVSFNLPAFLFHEEAVPDDLHSFFLSLESISDICREFNSTNGTAARTLGFSPGWDPRFLYIKAVLMGSEFSQNEEGGPVWNDAAVMETISYIRNWVADINMGNENEKKFNDRFMYDPQYKLINEKRILFYYASPKDYLLIPPDRRESLDLRWIARNNLIPVEDGIVFAGILRETKSRKAAESFLIWLFNPETQRELLRSSSLKRMRTFGFSGGFSSLQEINETSIPEYYPFLVGHIPLPDFLLFPPPLPHNWNEIKNQVIKKWLLEQTSGTSAEITLREEYEAWLRLKPFR